MWKPTAHAPEQVERFRARRDEAGIEYVVCHALYLVNLASPDPEIHAKSVAAMRASLETASAIGADGVVFHVGSHLGAGLDGGPRPRRARPARAPRADGRPALAPARELGRRRRDDRALGRRARDDLRPARPSPAPRHLPRLVPLVGVGRRRDGSAPRSTPRSATLDERIGIDRLRCLHVNDAEVGLGSNRDRHASLGLGHDRGRPRDLPRSPGVPGSSGDPRDRRARRHLRRRAGAPSRPAPEGPQATAEALALTAFGAAGSASQSTVAKTRKLGRSSGSSKNSGFRQPTSSTRCS